MSWSNEDVLLAMVLIAAGTTLAAEMAVLRRDNKLRPLCEGQKH